MTDAQRQKAFNIFDLGGRASRLEFAIVLVAWFAAIAAYRSAGPAGGWQLALAVGALASAPMILTGIRRLHDRDQSGWWMLLSFVPLIGLIFLVFLAAASPDERVNRFGPPARLFG